MKKITISLIVIISIVGLSYILKDFIALDTIANEDRFIIIDRCTHTDIVYDKQTKVEYAISNGPDNRGIFTLLVDQDGKPLLYKESEEK